MKGSALDTLPPDRAFLAFPPGTPGTESCFIPQNLTSFKNSTKSWVGFSGGQHHTVCMDSEGGMSGLRVKYSLGVSLARLLGHGPWNLGLLHGWGQLGACEHPRHPPESWQSSTYESSGHLWGSSQPSPPTGRFTTDLVLTKWGLGTNSCGYGHLPCLPAHTHCCSPPLSLPPQGRPTA